MKAWANIQISPHDPEIVMINNLEKAIGSISDKIHKIRELITRFEVCHFKYQKHLKKIKDSIIHLEPVTNPAKIGKNHVQHGENAWKKDITGKSLLGQQYIWAIKEWLHDNSKIELPDNYYEKSGQKIQEWLGEKNPEKTRLVRLLLARLTWDWKSLEELQHGGEHKDLEFQICRMDICHYAFPANLDALLQGMGNMKPVEKFEGCGSCNDAIKSFLEKEFSMLNSKLVKFRNTRKQNGNELIKAWLLACLVKTLKEQLNISKPVPDLAC